MFFQHLEYPGMDVAFTHPVLIKPDGCGFFWLKIKSQNFATESQERLIDLFNLFYTANSNPGIQYPKSGLRIWIRIILGSWIRTRI